MGRVENREEKRKEKEGNGTVNLAGIREWEKNRKGNINKQRLKNFNSL